ncbi:hypothetical protein LX36DRAFT_439223 [Colletotrichum falcatum]|nr:hypothetical protein LX36DRAFT_439223 [Colletotrichum falcatum]
MQALSHASARPTRFSREEPTMGLATPSGMLGGSTPLLARCHAAGVTARSSSVGKHTVTAPVHRAVSSKGINPPVWGVYSEGQGGWMRTESGKDRRPNRKWLISRYCRHESSVHSILRSSFRMLVESEAVGVFFFKKIIFFR